MCPEPFEDSISDRLTILSRVESLQVNTLTGNEMLERMKIAGQSRATGSADGGKDEILRPVRGEVDVPRFIDVDAEYLRQRTEKFLDDRRGERAPKK
jgi:hypothetical protein